MSTILLTGFEPFGGDSSNPSWGAVQQVLASWSGPGELHIRRLPVDFTTVGPLLAETLSELTPDLVICVGLASGAASMRLERIAINVDDARIPDNAGYQPVDEPVVPGAPAAYFSTLPIKAAVAQLREAGIDATVSQSAGTFTCNHVFYRLMHLIATEHPATRGGFVHVPATPELAGDGAPSMTVETMADALARIVQTALRQHNDDKLSGGALD